MQLKKFLLPVVVIAIAAVLMFVFLGMREEQQKRTPAPRARIVDARQVTLGPVRAEITAHGTLLSGQPVEVYSEVAGTLMPGTVPFQPAQYFKKGDILLRIDDRQIQLERQATISDLMNALANVLPEIRSEFPNEYPVWERYFNSLEFDKPIPSLPETSNQRIKLFLSRFNVYRLYFSVLDLQIEQGKYIIRAGFDGAIVSTALRAGSNVRGGSLIGSIINLQDLEVVVPLATDDLPWIDIDGETVFTAADLEGEWSGSIRRVGRSIEANSQTIPVYVEIDPEFAGNLPEGVFFNADLPGKSIDNAIEVPRRAVYEQEYVYVIRDGKLEYRQVHVVREQTTTVVVDGGLSDGDTLVIEPLQGVSPGMLASANLVEPTQGDQ